MESHKELALFALAIGVLRGIEAACRIGYFSGDMVEDLFYDGPEELVSGHLPGVEVYAGQLGVVIKHSPKETIEQASKLLKGIQKYQSGVDWSAPDRGDDPLRKAKYVLKHWPQYFYVVAIGIRHEFVVNFPTDETFELKRDFIPLLWKKQQEVVIILERLSLSLGGDIMFAGQMSFMTNQRTHVENTPECLINAWQDLCNINV